ncbi:MAG: hypothetical protein M3O70_15780 [Actinomycetota bacterium]|nr:hypothetical protein [Actinomycetota bacterium]
MQTMREQVDEVAERILMGALELMAGGERWTTRALARDPRGLEISPTSPIATRWCLAGAVRRSVMEVGLRDEVDGRLLQLADAIACGILGQACFDLHGMTVGAVNDEFGWEAVQLAMKQALAELQEGVVEAEG